MLSNLILSISAVLLQGVVLGILLILAVSFLLRWAGELNGATRGLVWLATLIALPLIPVLCWTNQLAPPPHQSVVVAPVAAAPIVHRPATEPAPAAPIAAPPRQLDFSVSSDAPVVLVTVYSITTALLLFRLFLSYLRIRVLCRRSHPAPAGVQARLGQWLERCPTDRDVRIGLSDNLRSPVAIGFLRPMILMPTALTLELSGEEFDDIGVHELAHIRRYDDWTNLLRQLLQALLFFHPAVYWAGRRLKFECEVACDDWVVAARGSKSYARCLTKVVELRRWERGALLSSGAFFNKAQILRRVELLLDKTRNSTTGISGFTTVAIILLTVGITLQVSRIPAMVSFTHHNGDSHVNAEWKDGDHDMKVILRGDMTLAPDERSIESLSPWGYVEIQESRGWSTRRLEVRPSSNGPEQKYFVDGHERPLDAAGREWTAATYAFLAREMGIDIDGRVERILAAKGVAGLFNEIDLIHSSSVRAKYLRRLLDRNDLTEDDLRRAAMAIRKIPSDHDKAELLRATDSRFTSDSARREYYHAVDSIRSDNDKASVLLTQSGCPALRTAATINSDFDKSRVLRESGAAGASECREAFFEVVNQIRSDNDRSNVLRSVLERSDMEPVVYQSIATAAAHMSSDNDKANVLTRLGEHYRGPEFFETVNTIRSDNDRTRVLHKALEGSPSKAVLLAVVEAAGRMNSDNEKANILVTAAKLSTDSEVRSAVKAACARIRSDNDYRRVATVLFNEAGEAQ
jgi:beta-lactamase regulating signal transducer with metallopeptidase domain